MKPFKSRQEAQVHAAEQAEKAAGKDRAGIDASHGGDRVYYLGDGGNTHEWRAGKFAFR